MGGDSSERLQRAIFLDRYAAKTPVVADATVFNRQKTGPHAQEVGKVVAIRNMTATVNWSDFSTSEQDVRDLFGLLETEPEQMWRRVAKAIASVEPNEEFRKFWEERFYLLLAGFPYVPGGRIQAGAGIQANLTFGNCFVIPSPRDSRGGIVDTLKTQAEIMARGGGVGFDISSLRPQGAAVRGVNGTSSGPVDFLNLYSTMTGIIEQAGSRRGAEMGTIHDWHPDLMRFISAKSEDEHFINHANLSVLVSDAFMQAVKDNAEWVFRFPDTTAPGYNEAWTGDLDAWTTAGGPVIEYDHMPARKVWTAISEFAHRRGEPGVIFIDTVLRESTTNANYKGARKEVSTNPCGEQPLPPFGVCNLGALNLASFVRGHEVDLEALAEMAKVAVRFQDNVIDASYYPLPENEEWAKKERRVGLGVMGLADMLIKMGLRYGSDKSLQVADDVFRTIRDAAYTASCDLAEEKGAFPTFDVEGYMQSAFVQRLPEAIKERIHQHGIRNITLLTVAPTGTTSLLAGVSSGIEPVFRFRTLRKDALGEHVILHPLAEAWQAEHPDEALPDYFVSAEQLSPEQHVKMQATAQRYIDASISKTVNAPNNHTVEDVQRLFTFAYKAGCKGCTYFRDGSTQEVVLREAAQPAKQEQAATTEDEFVELQSRPTKMLGRAYTVQTPFGSMTLDIHEITPGEPFEVFVNIGAAASDLNADAITIGRLASAMLRMDSRITPARRLDIIIDKLKDIRLARGTGTSPAAQMGTRGTTWDPGSGLGD